MASSLPHCPDTRPTLPPIHTLGLPYMSPIGVPNLHDFHDPNDFSNIVPADVNRDWSRSRQTSVSSTLSSGASSSRSVSPCDAQPSSLRSSFTASFPGFSLVRTTFDNANAIIVVPPPIAPHTSDDSDGSPSSPTLPPLDNSERGKAFLLVGPAVEHLRHPQRRITKGARMHPYRITRRSSRRASTSSTSTDV
ncbi:hypothetical protein AcV7_004014 [Taiwanofungus camphoratus]|nr:hypothetical protein AcV7_004014 [Antrodia cinnamomea]